MAPVTIPILPSADFDVTSGFYASLGFEETGRWPNDYLIVRHPDLGVELHFWSNPAVDRWTNDVGCYVRFENPAAAEACHRGWRDAVIPEPAKLSEPQEGPAPGSLEFHVIDLHGNLVRLGGFVS
jgi:hypothetical protein